MAVVSDVMNQNAKQVLEAKLINVLHMVEDIGAMNKDANQVL
jgi:hypothetical protein